ncbi:iron ABC transporter permease [Limnospira sp. PMC 289.06]|uniref:ABC transporter permease n=1 Tax=Limnospira sp. PMC 289.06 TaxID=2981094 RepID=UPI0028E0D110|nr:iron ABC transporter permease [Limnospira sp. PMC 289.06]
MTINLKQTLSSTSYLSTRRSHPPIFLVIMAAIVALGMALPLVYLVIRAMGIGLAPFIALISRPRTIQVFFNSIGMAFFVTLLSALIAIPLAFLIVRTNLPGRRFWSVVTTLPLAIPTYVGSFALLAFAGPRGSMIQILLEPFGVQRLPSIYGWAGVIIATTLFSYPYILLTVRSSLQGMDPAMEEVSRVLGYTPYQTFWRVTLPQLRPAIAAGSLLVSLYALQDFGTPALMRFESFTYVIFLQYRTSFDRSMAAALSLVLIALVGLILLLEYRARSRAAYYSRGSASQHQQPLIPLGRWTWLALGFCILITLFSLVMPLGVLFFWLGRGLRVGQNPIELITMMLPAAYNSIYSSGLAAIISTLFALPIAILAVRFPSRLTATLERTSYIGFGMPGIVVSLSLVFFGANYVPWLYQQLPMLIFAYLVLFIPQAVGTLRGSLLQVSPNLEESARILGRTPWQTLRQVTLPLVRPGVISGAMLIFLTSIKELPATLLLSPIGFRTLATQIWQATAESVAFTQASVAALMMLFVSTLATLIILSQERRIKNAQPSLTQLED